VASEDDSIVTEIKKWVASFKRRSPGW